MNTEAETLWQGSLPPGAVACVRTGRAYQPPAGLETAIDAAWSAGLLSGKRLFDGPMVRLERMEAGPGGLRLALGALTYKPFYALHMARPDLLPGDEEKRPNPLGVSAAVLTADHRLIFGQRSSLVAYYPGRIHPVAGAMEPQDADVFAAAIREVNEELVVPTGALRAATLTLIAVLRDPALRQPEAVVLVEVPCSSADINASGTEHERLISLGLDDDASEALTPVARTSLSLIRALASTRRGI